jgi:ABC-type transport system involved in Fe-S cluster assembly fused permease/ATPase subunit
VVDSPRATPLAMCNGDIKFKDVEFAYDYTDASITGVIEPEQEAEDGGLASARLTNQCGGGSIKFKDVEFAYDSRKPALNGLTFHCKPGTTTALVTGAIDHSWLLTEQFQQAFGID